MVQYLSDRPVIFHGEVVIRHQTSDAFLRITELRQRDLPLFGVKEADQFADDLVREFLQKGRAVVGGEFVEQFRRLLGR